MERWKGRMRFYFKGSFLLPTKGTIVKGTSCLKDKVKENGHGLVSLYKDMEACGGYADIQVMWEMIQSSRPLNDQNTSRKRPSQWKFCFKST